MDKFLEKIAAYTDNVALICDDKRYTYSDLLGEIQSKINLLKEIPSGTIVAIVGDYSFDNISFLLACLNKKLIIAPLLENSDNNDKIKESQIDYIYQNNCLTPTQYLGSSKHDIIAKLIQSNSNGLILFSSGSTGRPKAIVHNLDNILNSYLDKKPKNINILLFLMFDHIGGLNTLFNALSLGACAITIKDRKNIESIANLIQIYKISLLPASPSFLNLLLISEVYKVYDLSSLRLITYGTEKMPDSLLERLKIIFPKVRFHQTFGTSEVGIAQTKTKDNMIKLEGIDYKIINNELYLKSKTQSLGYLNADNSVFDDDGYFATGDLVESILVNGQEYLKIIGRSKEVINVGGEKVLPNEVEGVILQIPYIIDCLVYPEINSITGQSVSAKIVLDAHTKLTNLEAKKQIRAFCKDKLATFKIPSKVEVVDSLAISERFKKVRMK